MQKLIAKFKVSRSLADARRLVNYSYKHPFAEAFLTTDDAAWLCEAINMAREASRPAQAVIVLDELVQADADFTEITGKGYSQ